MRLARHPLALALQAGIVLAAFAHAPARAAEADAASGDAPKDAAAQQLDTIVVTAQKREQQVSDVPIAISAYSGEFMRKFGINDFTDIGNLVPGLEVQEQSPNNPGFVIRGITSDSGEANVEPRVSVFQDGVSISKSRGSVVQPFDLQRVEVLRGPQGTLFGRGAQIGAIHLIQNKAWQGTEGGFSAGIGNYNDRLLSGYYNAPLTDTLAARIAVFDEQRDGFVKNLSGGRLNGKDTRAVRGSLHLDVGETDSLDLILNWQKDTPPGTAFRSGSIPTRVGSTDVLDRTADLNRGKELGLDRTVRGATLLGSFVLSPAWTLNTITGWRDFDATEQFDADGSQLYALEFAEIAKGRQTSQEFRFNYDDGGRFTGFAGVSYFHDNGTQTVPFSTDERSFVTLPAVGLGIPPLLADGTPNTGVSALPIAPGVVLPLSSYHAEQYANSGRTTAWEVFADGTLKLADKLSLTAGLRGTHENVRAGYRADYFGTPSYLGMVDLTGSGAAFPNLLFAPTDGWRTRSDSFNSAVGRAVLDYRFNEHANGYVSVSRGRRPSVVQVDAISSEIVPAEIVWSYEAGLKGDLFDGALVYDVAAYHYDYSNFQTTIQDPNSLRYIAGNGGNASADGAELSLTWRASRNVSAFFNYGWIDATFDKHDDDGNPQKLAGNQFRLTPKNSASAGLDLGWDVGAAHLYARPSWNWRSHVYFEDDNTPGIEQDGYALVNLRLGVQLAEGRWDIALYGNNLADKDYLIDAGNTGRLFGTPTFIQGLPRTYGITVTGKF